MDREFITNLGVVLEINPTSITKQYPYDEIEYIDISSVGTGFFSGSTHMLLAEAPSRAKRLVEHGDTIIAMVRPNLRSFLYIKNPPKNMVVSTGFAVLRPNNKINSRFLYYTVTNQKFTDYLSANVRGAAYPAVDTETFARAKIWLPDLPVQEKIASILSTYDDLIENNLRRIKILEEMAKTIYDEWFVKFRFPGHEKVKMVKSELGMIPDGWEVKKLGEVCDIIMGQSPESKYYNNTGNGLPFHQGVKDFGTRFPTHTTYCTIDKRIAEKGDILFSVRAPVGRINIANSRIIIGRGLSAIRHKNLLQSFLFYQLKHIFIEEDKMGSGAIYNAVTKEDMINIKLFFPDKRVDVQFNEFVGSMDIQIENLQSKIDNLRKTRDLLLPKLISGEIDVENLDIQTGDLNEPDV
ncbi:MAG TPA: restriction endonuclease subunit S [Syntrophorhabdaceae bacterium]|nr:restriction endonuclease subunit S [Syntrophorhabdaceae bacterium]HOG39988.1 restriction endonuclease subunit S [Syntrophorhabdaceae bacterium]